MSAALTYPNWIGARLYCRAIKPVCGMTKANYWFWPVWDESWQWAGTDF